MPAAVLLIAFVLQLSQQALSTVHAESQPHFEVVPSKALSKGQGQGALLTRLSKGPRRRCLYSIWLLIWSGLTQDCICLQVL